MTNNAKIITEFKNNINFKLFKFQYCHTERSRSVLITMNYYTYILKCSDLSYYTGVTNNLENRFKQHQYGEDCNSYTYNRRPLELVFYEKFIDINQAINFEKQIKGWSRKKKEALIDRNWNKIKELAICDNKTSHKLYMDKN